MKIRTIFNAIAPAWRAKKRLASLKTAVDGDWIKTLGAEVSKLKEFGAAGDEAYKDLLDYAVRKGSLESFQTVFAEIKNPNYSFIDEAAAQESFGTTEPKNVTSNSLLYKAIQYSRTDIAAMLLNDSRTDATVSGYTESFPESESSKRRDFTSPLSRAGEKGLDEIVVMIEQRIAESNASKPSDRPAP